jgi:hypothetical protein
MVILDIFSNSCPSLLNFLYISSVGRANHLCLSDSSIPAHVGILWQSSFSLQVAFSLTGQTVAHLSVQKWSSFPITDGLFLFPCKPMLFRGDQDTRKPANLYRSVQRNHYVTSHEIRAGKPKTKGQVSVPGKHRHHQEVTSNDKLSS